MPRLSVPLTPEQHRAIKVKAAETGLPQAEIARRFLLAWVAGEIDLPEYERGDVDTYEFVREPGFVGAFPR